MAADATWVRSTPNRQLRLMNVRSNTSNITKKNCEKEIEASMAVDPVCGIQVEEPTSPSTDQYIAQYGNQTFHFCSEDCKEVFEESPQQYAKKPA
jgi:YHS domain-containing protein